MKSLNDLPGTGNVRLSLLVFAGVALAGSEVFAPVEDYVLGAHVGVLRRYVETVLRGLRV